MVALGDGPEPVNTMVNPSHHRGLRYRRVRARFDADVEAHYRTQISRFRADLRAAGG